MSKELALVNDTGAFHGLDILIQAMRQLATQAPDRFAADQDSFFRLAIEAGRLISADLNSADGALAAQKAAAKLVNLGLEHLVTTLNRKAVDILSKNEMEKVYAIGFKLVEESKKRSIGLLDRCVVHEMDDPKVFYGLLPFAIEHRLIAWSKFDPCGNLVEYQERMRGLDEAERLISLAKYFPTALVTGHAGLAVERGYDFVRWRFRRPGRRQPCVHGGIIDPLVWTLMIKCILGNYLPLEPRRQGDQYGYQNWRVTRAEILAFARLAVGEARLLEEKIEEGMLNIDAFFRVDAKRMFAAKIEDGWQEGWGRVLQGIFLRLVDQVREFYSHAPDEITIADIDSFWASRVVVDTEFSATSLHEHQVPRIEELLDCEMSAILEPLIGFRAWPLALRQKFATHYPFTNRLVAHDAASDFMNAGRDMGIVFQRMSPPDKETAVSDRAIIVPGSEITLEHARLVLNRLDLSRLNLRIVFGLHTHAPGWVQAELLRRMDEYRLSAKCLADIVTRGSLKSPEADRIWFTKVLDRLCATEKLKAGHHQTWAILMSCSPNHKLFPAVILFCPEEVLVSLMRRTDRSQIEIGLRQLSPEELIRVAKIVDPRLVSWSRNPKQAEELIRILVAATRYH